VFFVGLPTLNAASAQTDQNFQALINKVGAIYSQVGVSIGNVSYIDMTGAAATLYSDVKEDALGTLNKLSAHVGARPNAVNVFLVHSIGGFGFLILGEASGIPGNIVPGTNESGVAISMADFPNGLDGIAATWAHETGHWLGLFHTTEANGRSFDPLPDTPQCSSVPYDTNQDGLVGPP
jgi:Metallo-peptidase family M12